MSDLTKGLQKLSYIFLFIRVPFGEEISLLVSVCLWPMNAVHSFTVHLRQPWRVARDDLFFTVHPMIPITTTSGGITFWSVTP